MPICAEDEKAGAPVNAGAPHTEMKPRTRSARLRNMAVFAVVAVAWLVLDFSSKAYFNTYEAGQLISGPYLGVFDFRLVHNTGAAWGLFGDATFALGVLALAVCALIVVYLLVIDPALPLAGVIGGALVFAGGIGNAVDRFTLGYVVDFIEPVFIDFPVFNIADIGVTCGVVLFVIALLWGSRRSEDGAQ